MDLSVNEHHILDCDNYSLWPNKNQKQIMTKDDDARKFIRTKWTSPQTMNKDGNPNNISERRWEDVKRHEAEVNEKVLKVNFEIIYPNLQELISTCSVAKDARTCFRIYARVKAPLHHQLQL